MTVNPYVPNAPFIHTLKHQKAIRYFDVFRGQTEKDSIGNKWVNEAHAKISYNILLYSSCNFIKKETLEQVFSCEFFEISENNNFYSTPPDDCFFIKPSHRHVWTSNTLRSDIINQKQLLIGEPENSFIKYFVKFLGKLQSSISFEIFFRTAFLQNTSR